MEMGTNYTCRFGDEATGIVVQAKSVPDCTIGPATNGNTAVIDISDVESNPSITASQIGEVREQYVGIGELGAATATQVANNAVVRDGYSAEDSRGLDDTGVCTSRMVCSAVAGDVGTASVVTISLNGQQYTSTQQLFTYYGQTGIPLILDDGVTQGIRPDRSPRNETQVIAVSYLYACGFQSEFESWMQCKYIEQQGRALVEKSGVDIMQGAYISEVEMSCSNPARGWVHDALLSVALNAVDYTEERLFIYYGDAIAMIPFFADSAEAEFCNPACTAGAKATTGAGSPETEFCDRHSRCLYQKESDNLVDVGEILLEAQDENSNWVPQDIAVVGYELIWFVTSERPDRFQSYNPLNASGCEPHQRLTPPHCTPDNLDPGVDYISGEGPTGPCHREECLSGNVLIPCYVNQTYEKTTVSNRTGNNEL
jgi:hypothetical protein